MQRLALAIDIPSLDELLLLEALTEIETPVRVLYPYVEPLPQLTLSDCVGVFSRLQHRYRRYRFAAYLKGEAIPCFHDFGVEAVCHSKVSQKQAFQEAGLPMAAWLLGEFPLGRSDDGRLAADRGLLELLSRRIDGSVGFPAVVKSTESSRGSSLVVVRDRKELELLILSASGRPAEEVPLSLHANPANPEGLFVEGFLPHALDLRCMMSFDSGDGRGEFLGCFARVAEREDRIVKTVIGGATAVGIEAPRPVRSLTEACLRAVSELASTGYGTPSGHLLLGVDIIARCEVRLAREEIYAATRAVAGLRRESVDQAVHLSGVIRELLTKHGRGLDAVVRDQDYRQAVSGMDSAYRRMAESGEYGRLRALVSSYLSEAELYAGEVNARMDFGTHCRVLCAPAVARQFAQAAVKAFDYSPK